ncbi:MAG: DUF4404 family protein [Planctomycetota bacterium]|nr:DUF4404 family protein [Planctomycetota bacterium]
MTNVDLEQLLDSLRQNLADNPAIDKQVAEKMQLLVEDIQNRLTRPAAASQPESAHPLLAGRVQELIDDFQAHHPRLTSNLSMIAERLADMGI